MRKIEIEVPESLYKKVHEQYGSRKKVEDILSVRLEANIRKNRRLLTRPKPERTTIISVYVKEHLYPYFNQLLIDRSQTRQNFVIKMLKRLSK